MCFNRINKPSFVLFVSLFFSSQIFFSQTFRKSLGIDLIEEQYTIQDLKKWEKQGKGEFSSNHGQVMLREVDGSKGYMLISPKSYQGNTVLAYDLMMLNAATVMVTELAAHNSEDFGLNFEDDYDGNVFYLFDNVAMYMFAFHNAAHNKPGPFVRKFPKPGKEPLVIAQKNVMDVGKYHHLEMGILENKLFFEIDGELIWTAEDKVPIKGGKLIIRIRGTGYEKASCLIKNTKIYTEK